MGLPAATRREWLMAHRVPWWVKFGGKIALSRLPIPYRFWKRLGLFEHGANEDPDYAVSVGRAHFAKAGLEGRAPGFTALELGPGDSLAGAFVMHALGAARTYMVDAGNFVSADPLVYQALAQRLELPEVARLAGESVDGALAAVGGVYLTDGLASLRTIPDASVDFVWSQAVLEHVRRAEFGETMRELRRILRPDGSSSHCIDFTDHLGGRLNNLRFKPALWESPLIGSAGFYTNRLRFADMQRLFAEAGLAAEVYELKRWDSLPTPLERMQPEFRAYGDDLLVSLARVVLRPQP